MTRVPSKRKTPIKSVWALYDQDGLLFDVGYTSYDEAQLDAVGPRFCRSHTIREYRLVRRKDESPRTA